jgi:hypothetical protein
MRFHLILAAVLAATSVAASAQASGCNLGVAKAWVPFKGHAYGSEAYSNGASCAGAVVTIVVRARGKQVLWTDAMPTAQLMTFVEAKTPRKMKAALVDWLAQPHTFKSSADLPDWKKGADAPDAGEFPFYPEAGVYRDTYMQIRAEKQAMFCYVQGMESMACVAIAKDGAATKVGLQTFPG